MQITGSAVSLNVQDVSASAEFVKQHFGFREEMSADGFVSLARDGVGFNLVFLRTGLASLQPPVLKEQQAQGVLVAFVVDDIDAEYAKIQAAGVPITTPIQTEPWGERFFQVTDPNGVILQLVQWMHSPEQAG
ncbi:MULTISPECIES: VOC family protein [Micromonospora]|uniref:Glyoxalase n=1 Tax=Micromonospora gifhornensis TaxID=84594 RepID=A0ABQ4IA57_9ACTN|nr:MULTISPECIES: VOC family protein [Micromonospora]PMR57848.1 glyoxalase [Verrucosispora sp. ts21]GIJ14772.1 glyoxalase [Micromonospora gifhornensis]